MKVLMTGGGSAGHITPILSVATEFKKLQPKAEIRYVGQRGDTLGSLTTAKNSPIDQSYAVFAGKWRRYHGVGVWAHIKDWRTILKNLRDLVYLAIGFVQSLIMLIRWRPQVVFIKGGFVGMPVGLAAACLRVPIVTHDSDALPGLTNRVLSRFAAKQCVGLPIEYYKQYSSAKMVHTGVPTNVAYAPLTEKQKNVQKERLQLPKSAVVLTIFGGSLGAVRLNNAVLEIAPTLLRRVPNLHILHVTGATQNEEIATAYNELPKDMSGRIWTWPFLPNLHEITGVADVVVARAGATSLAELGLQEKATIIVPNPYLVGGHQTHNARLLEDKDAAVVVTEKELAHNITAFEAIIDSLLHDERRQKQLGKNLRSLCIPDAAQAISRTLIEVAA